MVAATGLQVPVIGWQETRGPQDAGHNQGPSDLGDHSPDGLHVHAPRVPKAPPIRVTHPGGHAAGPSARRLTASSDQIEGLRLSAVVSDDSAGNLALHHGALSRNFVEQG